ncbi:MAG: alpha/beta family hydrolase [Acidobacteriota bacterium]
MEIRIEVDDGIGSVSGILRREPNAHGLLVLAHGAGAGMRHVFMEALTESLAEHGVATLRYQFPYMERGGRRPDGKAKLHATVRAAVLAARAEHPDLPLFAGGKSMGGRMTSEAAAVDPLPAVQGLVFVGFPLHPAGKPGTTRGDHLDDVDVPMLFLQGTRDKLADLDLLRPVLDRANPTSDRVTLHVVDGADHGFHVLKRSGRTDDDVIEELARSIARWTGVPSDDRSR